jgi:hypothetical protein
VVWLWEHLFILASCDSLEPLQVCGLFLWRTTFHLLLMPGAAVTSLLGVVLFPEAAVTSLLGAVLFPEAAVTSLLGIVLSPEAAVTSLLGAVLSPGCCVISAGCHIFTPDCRVLLTVTATVFLYCLGMVRCGPLQICCVLPIVLRVSVIPCFCWLGFQCMSRVLVPLSKSAV